MIKWLSAMFAPHRIGPSRLGMSILSSFLQMNMSGKGDCRERHCSIQILGSRVSRLANCA